MKKFALIGAAGYVAPRHMKAIKETGNDLSVALDPFDSVGILDHHFPNTSFFMEFERFDRYVNKLQHTESSHKIDYMSICSPNYLHDSHIRYALRSGTDAICEKPLVLNPWNLDDLAIFEKEFEQKIYNILQLRLHPSIIALKQKIDTACNDKKYDLDLTYITSRGVWYQHSWKGNEDKSGGIATNIGIHFFDMLIWIFGSVQSNVVHLSDSGKIAGYMELEKARVRWFMSIDEKTLPDEVKTRGERTYRSIQLDNQEIEFSQGFTDLHTLSYQHILSGGGYGVADARASIEAVHDVRAAKPVGLSGDYHPFCKGNVNDRILFHP